MKARLLEARQSAESISLEEARFLKFWRLFIENEIMSIKRFPMKIFFGCIVTLVSGCCSNSVGTSAKAPTPNTPRQITVGKLGTFRVTRTLESVFYSDSVSEFAFSPDGKMIAGVGGGIPKVDFSGGDLRGLVFLYDATTGKLLKRIAASSAQKVQSRYFQRVSWSPDGKYLAAWSGASDTGAASSLFVWDVQRGQLTCELKDGKTAISAAAWGPSGELLVSRSAFLPSPVSQMVICSRNGATIRKIVNLGKRSVGAIETATTGAPRMLVMSIAAGQPVAGELPRQCSVCRWRNDALSAPLVNFPVGDAYFDAAFGKNIVALCGIRQFAKSGQPALFVLANTQTKRIVWQKQQPSIKFSERLWLSPDERQIFPKPHDQLNGIKLNARTGASFPLGANDFLIFSPNGKRILRRLQTEVPGAKKPHLPIAELLER